jgi:hypothetical protein
MLTSFKPSYKSPTSGNLLDGKGDQRKTRRKTKTKYKNLGDSP